MTRMLEGTAVCLKGALAAPVKFHGISCPLASSPGFGYCHVGWCLDVQLSLGIV